MYRIVILKNKTKRKKILFECQKGITAINKFNEIKSKNKVVIPIKFLSDARKMYSVEYDLAIIEDAAQALGAQCVCGSDPGTFQAAGGMGQYGCFSFFPTKNLGGFGEGGMVVTRDAGLAQKIYKLYAC